MKAVAWTKYGPPDGLRLEDIEKPVPKDNEVLIRIQATTVTMGDCEFRRLQLPILFRFPVRLYVGILRPKRIRILGQEMAGEIEAVGKNVNKFKKGDRLFGTTGFRLGAYAEYVCLPEDGTMAIIPANMTPEEAACVPVGGLYALNFLRAANVGRGQKVLIIGAGGSIGTFGVQLARYFGAEVTGVDRGEKLDMLRSLGAARVIDYTREDFTKSSETYDVIFDVAGRSSFSGCVRSLKPGGYYILANPGLRQTFRGLWTSLVRGKKVITGSGSQTPDDLVYLGKLIEAGKIQSVIDRRYTLEQMAEAHQYVESGLKRGNVVISVGNKPES